MKTPAWLTLAAWGGLFTVVNPSFAQTWTQTSAPITNWSSVASSADGSKLVAGTYDPFHPPFSGGNSSALTSTNSGATWEYAPSAGSRGRGLVASSADGTVLVKAGGRDGFGNGGPIYISTDAGATWRTLSATNALWSSVAVSALGNKVVAAAEGGGIYTFFNPVIYVQPASQTVPAGISVTFSVGVFGAAPFAYRWALNDTNLPDATNATLTLTNLHLFDSGSRYSVLVSNSFGIAVSSNALLTVLPALVTAWPPSQFSPTGAVFNGSVTPGSSETMVWFEWGTETNYGKVTPAVDVGTGFIPLSFNSSVTDLAIAAVYHFRLFASNILGTVASTDARFATPHPPFVRTSAPDTNWLAVAGSADGTKLVAVASGAPFGAAGPIYTSTNSGATWTHTSAPVTNWSSVASSADGSKLVAVVNGGGIYISQFIPAPLLSLSPSGTNLALSWTVPSMDFELQQKADLNTPEWTDVMATPTLNFTNLQNQVVVSQPTGNRFYRLKSP